MSSIRLPSFVFLAFLLLPWKALYAEDTELQANVSRVINGKSFELSSGQIVRLAAIQAPNIEEVSPSHIERSGEPMGSEAKQALEKLVSNHTLRLFPTSHQPDRHGRLLAQAYAADVWLQGALLEQGYAMVYSFSDTPHDTIRAMLSREQSARQAMRGIWAHPYYRVITPAETPDFINRFKLVQGKVISVHNSHGNWYINFFDRWQGKFAVFISHKYAGAFASEDLPSLAGKVILVRGWIHFHHAPMISLTHPDEIEFP